MSEDLRLTSEIVLREFMAGSFLVYFSADLLSSIKGDELNLA